MSSANIVPPERLERARRQRRFEECEHKEFTEEAMHVDKCGNGYFVSTCRNCGCGKLRPDIGSPPPIKLFEHLLV
jgi:hypothetical protein